MSKKYPAGIISKDVVAPNGNWATSSASGIWTLDQQVYWQNQGLWPDANNPQDTYFKNVTMLLHGDGTNGAQNNTFLDSSLINSTITRAGNTTQGAFAPYGISWSNLFNVNNDKLTLSGPNLSGLTNFTFECWVNFNSFGSDRKYFLGVSGSPYYQLVHDSSAGISFRVTGYVKVVGESSNSGWAVGTWYHVALVKSGNTYTIYKDGVSIATSTYSTALPSVVINYLGGFDSTTGLNAYMSNIRITNTAVYTAAFTPPVAPLTAITGTQLLTAQSNRFVDNSTNQFSLTVSGTPRVQRFSPLPLITRTPTSYSGYFDGASDYLSIADNAAFDLSDGDFTIEAWVYHTTPTGAIQVYYSHQTNGLSFYRNASGYLEVAQDSVGVLLTSANTVNTNQWVHVAASRSSGTLRLFVSGTLDATSFNATVLNSSNSVYIASAVSGGSPFTGFISNLRLVKGSAVYTATFTVPTTPLSVIGGTSLLTCQSGGFVDNSTNAFTINVTGNSKTVQNNPFGATTSQPLPYSTAIAGGSTYFDGTGDYLTLPNNASQQLGFYDFTIDFWFYSTGAQGSGDVLANGYSSGSDLNWLIQADVSTMKFYASVNGSSWAVSGLSMGDIVHNQWNYFAVTRSGSTIITYLNGVKVTSATLSGTIYGNASGIAIGTDNSSPATYPIQGYVTDFRMVIGTAIVPPADGPTAPVVPVTNTKLLLSSTNAGIFDNAMMNDLETVGNAQISTSVKKYGTGSMYFDGTGDWLQLPITPQLYLGTTYTIEAWIYPLTVADWEPVFSINEAFTGGFTELGIYRNGTLIRAAIRTITNGTTTYIEAGTVAVNTWYHVALSVSAGSAKLFLNGTQIGSTTTFAEYPIAKTTYAAVGNWGNGFSTTGYGPWNGYIDDLRITKGVARYIGNFTPPTSQVQDQ